MIHIGKGPRPGGGDTGPPGLMPGADGYHLGLPAWAFPGWRDRYFTDKPSRLANYAQVFDTVEGNTTFYRVPDPDTIERWRKAVAQRPFRFCFKLPREVTHDPQPDLGMLDRFVTAVAPLSRHLGPLLVQFPASVDPGKLQRFEPVFEALGDLAPLAIEVRHEAFFRQPALLEPVLERYRAGRVCMDSRPIFAGDRTHPELLDALHEKPDLPVLPDAVYGHTALIRLILHPDIASNRPYLEEWAGHVAAFISRGVQTYMMIHCPNNLHCPPLARQFHEALRVRLPSLAPLSSWPVPQQSSLL